jgi:hypothetical protein
VVTTKSKHKHPIAPNVVARNFEVTAPNQVWVSDLTYLRTETGFVYLAVVLDLFARRVVGWAVSRDLDAGIAVEALRRALAVRPVSVGMIHHSARGVRARHDGNRIKPSMRRKGTAGTTPPPRASSRPSRSSLSSTLAGTTCTTSSATWPSTSTGSTTHKGDIHTITISVQLTLSGSSVKQELLRNPRVHEPGASPGRRYYWPIYAPIRPAWPSCFDL